MPASPDASGRDLLKHFDPDLASRLTKSLSSGAITAAHIQEIIRLTSELPQFRDAEEFESLLEDAEEMEASAFKEWVTRLLADERDQ